MTIHGAGAGVFTEEDVTRRAQEIASIEGRLAPTPEDRETARAELTGENARPTIEDDAETMNSLSRDPSDPPSNRGSQKPMLEAYDDDHKVAEHLVSEGVEEADHELMLEARKRKSDL